MSFLQKQHVLELRRQDRHDSCECFCLLLDRHIPWITIIVVGSLRELITPSITINHEGSLEVKLPTIWTDEKQRWEESEKGREEERISKKRESQKKEDPGARKGRKVAKKYFFHWIVAPEGRKVGSLKRRVRSHLARWEMKSCTPLWHEAHFQVKMYKAHNARTTFGSWDVEKVPALVARSTFPGQNAQSTPFSDHFWKLRCRKSARRCGAKHFSKSKVQKLKGTEHFWTFSCRFCVAGAGDCAPCQKWAKRKDFVAVSATTTTIHYTPLRYNYNYN